jgi:hypothetical protein
MPRILTIVIKIVSQINATHSLLLLSWNVQSNAPVISEDSEDPERSPSSSEFAII